jgi:thiol-disulfide isomerase/thioredoxin
MPVWRSLLDAYKPNDAAVAKLKAIDQPVEVTVVLGTWCPDSRSYVPRLMKSLQEAGNAKLKVKLVGIDYAFRQPTSVIQPRGIINVPTVIVERGGREIGRIIETPAASTIEEDLTAILAGKPNVHKGRWEHGPQIARGAYLYRDPSGKECGSETWELYGTSEGGSLVHSEVKTGDLSTNVFHRVNGKGQTSFVEITRQRGTSVTRVRYTLENNTLSARLRGNVSGVVQQTIETPGRFGFSSPSVASEGRAWPETTKPISTMPTFVASAGLDATIGLLSPATYEVRSEETLRVRGGEFQVRHVTRKTGTDVSEFWLHKATGVPVRGRLSGGMEYELVSLESGAGK